jgi:PIN domain nuclease of toxin-antitoxin system
VRLLLDTHTLLWALSDVPRLSEGAHQAIEDSRNAVFVSAASAWEIAIKGASGRLTAPADLETRLEAKAFSPLDITVAHGLRAGALPLHHRDPFDRMLVAQAQMDRLTIVTRDPRIAIYEVAVLPA